MLWKAVGVSFFIFIIFSTNANAGIILGTTRVIYDGSKKEVFVNVHNPDEIPYLIQSWIESSEKQKSFLITPPLFRLDGRQSNLLRIMSISNNLPADRESLFWLNIKSIPSRHKDDYKNTLQIAINTRIKLIYRPTELIKQTPEEVVNHLGWQRIGKRLKIINPTGFYMNFHEIMVGNSLLKDTIYIAPKSMVMVDLGSVKENDVHWQLINDYGGLGKIHTATALIK